MNKSANSEGYFTTKPCTPSSGGKPIIQMKMENSNVCLYWVYEILHIFFFCSPLDTQDSLQISFKKCWKVWQECYVILSMHRMSELKLIIKIIYPSFRYTEGMAVQKGGGSGLVSWPSSSASQFSACSALHLGFPIAVFSEHWPCAWHSTGHCWGIMIVINY